MTKSMEELQILKVSQSGVCKDILSHVLLHVHYSKEEITVASRKMKSRYGCDGEIHHQPLQNVASHLCGACRALCFCAGCEDASILLLWGLFLSLPLSLCPLVFAFAVLLYLCCHIFQCRSSHKTFLVTGC